MTRVRINRRVVVLPAATLIALFGLAVTGQTLPLPTGEFGITPARRHIVGVPALELSPTTVINSTDSRYRVKVFPVLLQQDLTGAFTFSQDPHTLNAAQLVLGATPTRFTLAPHSRREVRLDWETLPRGHRSIAVGVVFQGTAVAQHGPVHIVSRLLSVNFLRMPGSYRIAGRFTRLDARQPAPRVLEFLPRVKNTGNRFWAPSGGRFSIRNAAGRIVYATRWQGDVVLPGAQREFPILVRKLLPAGNYTDVATMRFGGRRRISSHFTLVAPNTLPTPEISLVDLNANGEVGSPARATGEIASSGTAAAGIRVRLDLYRTSAPTRSLGTGTVSYTSLNPGARVKFDVPVGGSLQKGAYLVTASWEDPSGDPHSAQAEFTATAQRGWLSRIWSWINGHSVLLIVLLALLVIALLVYLMRRRRRELEAELASLRERIDEQELTRS